MKRFMMIMVVMLMGVAMFGQTEVKTWKYATKAKAFGRVIPVGDHVYLQDSLKEYEILVKTTALQTMANYFTLGSTYYKETRSGIAGIAAFTTTGTRLGIYVKGTTTSSLFIVSANVLTHTSITVPVAGDLLAWYAVTDTLYVYRPAAGTSGLKVSYLKIK